MINHAVDVLVFTAAGWALLFVGQYLRGRPWRTVGGRLILAFMGAIAALLVAGVAFRVIGDGPLWPWIRLVSWVIVNIIMAGAWIAVLLVQRGARSRGERVSRWEEISGENPR